MLSIFNDILRQQVRYSATVFQPSEQYLLVEEISTSAVQVNAVRKISIPGILKYVTKQQLYQLPLDAGLEHFNADKPLSTRTRHTCQTQKLNFVLIT
jgi:hypothetical protein